MDQAVPKRALRVTLSVDRVPSLALCSVWAFVAIANILTSFDRMRAGDALEGAHHLVIGVALTVNAAIFLLRGPVVARKEGMVPKAIAVAGTWIAAPLALMPLTWDSDRLMAASTFAIILAYAWIIWSLLALRNSFSIFPEARQLVRSGPYGIVRHPLYAAYIVTDIALLAPRMSLLGLLLAVIAIGAHIWRARFEEGVLGQTFPEYVEYAHRTPRFFPVALLARRRDMGLKEALTRTS